MMADATMNLIWNGITAKTAPEGERVKEYKCHPSDSIWATEQSPTMLFALEGMREIYITGQ